MGNNKKPIYAADFLLPPFFSGQVIIPVANISVLKKANTALLVPNAICIRTSEGEKVGDLCSQDYLAWMVKLKTSQT